jgi:hypothetical protein
VASADLPPEQSLEALFLAARAEAGPDPTHPVTGARLAHAWSLLAELILRAAEAGEDPSRTGVFARAPGLARERAFLLEDHAIFRQDVARGQRWRLRVPEGPARSAGLILRQPRSVLFNFWARRSADSATGQPYLFLGVCWGAGQWAFSTDPLQRLPIRSLAEALQAAESARDPTRASADPWYDGARHGHTLVAAPRAGTVLADEEVLAVVRRWGRARPIPTTSRRLLLLLPLFLVNLLGALGLWVVASRPPERASPVMSSPRGVDHGPGGNLHVLCVGVSRYRERRVFPLAFAAEDARTLAGVLRGLEQRPFRKVRFYSGGPLTAEAATRANILEGLSWLANRAAPDDLSVFTFSGYGMLEPDGEVALLPYDAVADSARSRVSLDEVLLPLGRRAKGPVLVVLDTSVSGALRLKDPGRGRGGRSLEKEVEKFAGRQRSLADGPGLLVLAASQDPQAVERPPGHGALTQVVLEGLTRQSWRQGRPVGPLPGGAGQRRVVTLRDLYEHVRYRVPQLTGGRRGALVWKAGALDLAPVAVADLRPGRPAQREAPPPERPGR